MNKYEKRIELYGDGIGAVEYVDHMGTDLTVVNAARVSFGKHKDEIDDRDEKLIKYLITHKHTSTLEHNVVTFRFIVPLYVRSQHHRHRTWSYNETSKRYSSENIRFYEPAAFRGQHSSNRQASNHNERINPHIVHGHSKLDASSAYMEHNLSAVQLYNELTAAGVCREQARGVLPNCLYTEYYGSTNFHNCLKFCSLRLHEGAQWEIQQVARALIVIMKDLWPITTDAWIESLEDPILKASFQTL